MKNLKKLTELLGGAGAVPYIMAAVLLICAFILPGIGREERQSRREAQQAAEPGREESGAQQVAESGMQQAAESGRTESGAQQTAEPGAQQAAEPGRTESGVRQDGQNTALEDPGTKNRRQSGSAGVIVLDPGHGGEDPGVTGGSGIAESSLNLIYAKKLQALLEEEGYRVVLTRENGDGLYDADASRKKAQDMQRRVERIAQESPLLTVSIHQNSYQDPAVCGPQVFYYEHSAQGERLAGCIQSSLNEALEIARPRTQKANGTYYILKRSESTAVIVECGFLSNPEEEKRLQEEEYQNRAAQAICDGILRYLAGEAA